MVIDAHQHFWDPGAGRLSLDGGGRRWRRSAAPSDRPISRHCLARTASMPAFWCNAAPRPARPKSFCASPRPRPLSSAWSAGSISPTARSVRRSTGWRLPGGNKLVGIRHQVHDEGDPLWLLREDVQRGLAAVFEHGLTYDLWCACAKCRPPSNVARAFPRGRFVLDHAAKPPIAEGFSRLWADRLVALAALPQCLVQDFRSRHRSEVEMARGGSAPVIDHACQLLWRRSPALRLGLAGVSARRKLWRDQGRARGVPDEAWSPHARQGVWERTLSGHIFFLLPCCGRRWCAQRRMRGSVRELIRALIHKGRRIAQPFSTREQLAI